MATFRTVEVWPMTGFPDRPWRRDDDEDAFTKSARSVCELYSEGLAALGLVTPRSALRLFCDKDFSRDDVLVEVEVEPAEGFEIARVQLPPGVAGLTARDRAVLVLEVVHGASARLVQARSIDPAELEPARDHVVGSDFRYRWTSPWKSSPDRRHRARATYTLADDGYGRVRLQVRAAGEQSETVSSAQAVAFSTPEGFRRSARTLRWDGSCAVELVPYCGPFGGDDGLLRFEVPSTEPVGDRHATTQAAAAQGAAEAGSDAAPQPPRSDLPRPQVVVRGANAPEAEPEIRVLGGGPMNGVPREYMTVLTRLLRQMTTPEWAAWWSGQPLGVLEILYDFAASAVTTSTRASANRLTCRIRRPVGTLVGADDPASLAQQDVEAVVAAVRRRTGLGPPPPLVPSPR